MKSSFARPCIERLRPYVPGEQPKISGLIKLNTNENPYPPSPKVLAAIRRELDERLRLYPDPTSDRLRARIAAAYGFRLDQVIAGNGSDDILTLCLRAFVDDGAFVQFPRPTYSLYPVLTQIQNGKTREIPFDDDFALDPAAFDARASLTLVVHPNAPTGTPLPQDFLRELARRLKGVLVVDEAYADFANENALALARKARNVLVTRSFSKSFSLAGMRLGFAVGDAALVEALFKVKDSYNLDRLAQTAGVAALSDMPYHRRCVARVVRTRERLRRELERRGWRVVPSQANFLLVRPPGRPAGQWLGALKIRRILVRWFDQPETRDFLRITMGTDRQMDRFLSVVDDLG
ncbi:MAG: histidinol-phosphate transaminase [Verrucomicrobia bacterium]|nr:histidinol-phosphate transaminase [Verrucomicrobiota bacterium]